MYSFGSNELPSPFFCASSPPALPAPPSAGSDGFPGIKEFELDDDEDAPPLADADADASPPLFTFAACVFIALIPALPRTHAMTP